MVSPLVGTGLSILSSLISDDTVWSLRNLDSGDTLKGQFAPEDLNENLSTNYAQHKGFNREHSIIQFVNGNNDTASFRSQFYKLHSLDESPKKKLDKLKSWIKMDKKLRRPPILQISVGDGYFEQTCVITGISDVSYGRADRFGGLRSVSFGLTLLQFTPYSLSDEEETDTRYHRVKDGEYYELLAYREYNNPLLGDVIRKNHPSLQLLASGNTVALPAINGIKSKKIEQTSTTLKTAFGRKDTSQRQLRILFLERNSGSYVSHVLQPSTSGAY